MIHPSPYDLRLEPLPTRGVTCKPLREGARLTTAEALHLMEHDEAFRTALLAALAGAPYDAYAWETPAVTSATSERPFEFVLLERPDLEVPPDPAPFSDYLGDDSDVVVFENLSGDAVLVVPTPRAPHDVYAHLGRFVRGAPDEQRHALLQELARAWRSELGDAPLWLSTAGGGVAWLHVRLDMRPKYYGHTPYRARP